MKREKNHWLFYILLCLFVISISLYYSPKAHATIFFQETSESRTCNSPLPWYWERVQGYFRCDGDAYAGSKYMDWHVPSNAICAYVGIDLGVTSLTGKTIYKALYFKITRIGGKDVWHNDSGQSYDKFFEIGGSGVRWIYKIGKHESGCYPALNQPNHFTMWLGTDRGYNPSLECVDGYTQNANGYSGSNPYQISYDAWHAAVMEVKIDTGSAGYIRGYIDGVKVVEYMNIKTANAPATLTGTLWHGTFAQPAYDTPEHYRSLDNVIITDNWQDIVDGGYLQDPNQQPDTTPPAAPSGLVVN